MPRQTSRRGFSRRFSHQLAAIQLPYGHRSLNFRRRRYLYRQGINRFIPRGSTTRRFLKTSQRLYGILSNPSIWEI